MSTILTYNTAEFRLTILRFFILSFLVPISSYGQDKTLDQYEQELNEISPILLNGKNELERFSANEKFVEIWDLILDNPKSLKHKFESIKNFPIITSKDKKLRIINWIVALDNNTYQYHGIVQYFNSSNKYQVSRLIPLSGEMKNVESIKLENNNWYGALYYQMEEIKRGNKKYYVLLGWNGNDERSNIKVIDVLSVKKDLVFGAPIFRVDKKRLNRYIIEYKEDASASIKFKKKEDRIVLSNLIPLNDGMEGLYDYYVPDGSINAFELSNGSFKLKRDVENTEKVNIPKIRKIRTGLMPN
ncbi:MAG: hypothetical protein QNK68_03330 [Flavobacteriales bacterium]|tara:strand:+ start:3371 stop:4273 length:903 start_codon:yes stop_codon:yes gene_type:complete